MSTKKILIVGANGMLARPVVRRLVAEGIDTRVFIRSRLHPTLPTKVDIAHGDLKDIPAIDQALDGCDAVYVSVETHPGDSFRAETQGLANVVTALKNHPSTRLMVLSALGNSNPLASSHPWWHIREKYEAQQITQQSKLNWTLFEPTWFMESLPLFVKKKTCWTFPMATFSSYWIAADDMARMIHTCLLNNVGAEKIIPVQGKEKISFQEALRNFCSLYDPSIKIKTMPDWLFRLMGYFVPDVRELVTLFGVSSSFDEPSPNPEIWKTYGAPQISLPDYVASLQKTNDFPQK